MKAENLKICGKCREVFQARSRKRVTLHTFVTHKTQSTMTCPKCGACNVMPLPAVVRTSAFFNEGAEL